MRFQRALIASLALLFAVAVPCSALDWKAFEDPGTVLLTDPFAKAIGELPEAEKAAAVKRLHESLKSKLLEVRRRAALTLGSLGDKGGVPTMIEDLVTENDKERVNIVVALRILKDDRAVPALRKSLKDSSPFIRGIAASALGEMKAVKAYDDLVALTRDKQREPEKPGTLNCIQSLPAHSACYALGALGDRRAVPVLIELLPDLELRNGAKQSLEALTGQKFEFDVVKWTDWWKAQPAPKDADAKKEGK